MFAAALAAVVLTTSSPAQALPQDPDAKAKLEEGLELYRAEDWAAASAAFAEGYAIENDPIFLYTQAQAERQQGNCEQAVKLYTEFIETEPPEVQAEAARDGKARCADILANRPITTEADDEALDQEALDELAEEVSSPPPPELIELPPSSEPEEGDPDLRPWYRDPAGGVLVGTGAAAVVGGVGLLIAAQVVNQEEVDTEPQALERADRVRTFRIAGGVVGGLGAALLIGGVVRWVVVARRSRETSVGLLYDGQMAGLRVGGRF